MSNEGFLEALKNIPDGPEFDPTPVADIPVDPTHPDYKGVSGNLSWQQSQEEVAKESIPFSEQGIVDMEQMHYYEDSIIMFAIDAVNSIKGLEFESYEDWELHVDKVVAKIKANRS
jgi:hypothetical protein